MSFRRLPRLADLQHDGEYLFRAFRHATRKTPEEEASVVACLGYDDIGVVCGQMEFYEQHRRPSTITPLTTGTVLLREHHHGRIARFGRLWWESILAFSKRDQLSLDFAREEAGVATHYWPGSTDDNAFVRWNGSLGSPRVQASFDAKRFDLIVVFGLPGSSVEAATQKLIRMAEPQAGGLVAVLTSPVPLAIAAAAEALVQQVHGACASTALQATRHDGAAGSLPNTLLATHWQRVVADTPAASTDATSEENVA